MHPNHALVPLGQISGNSNLFKCQISEPTFRGLLVRGATCLYGFPTYLQGTVCLDAACFLLTPNLPPGDSLPGLQPVSAVSNPTYRGMSVHGAACLYRLKTYLTGTVGWGCSQFIWFLYLFRNVLYSKSCLDSCLL